MLRVAASRVVPRAAAVRRVPSVLCAVPVRRSAHNAPTGAAAKSENAVPECLTKILQSSPNDVVYRSAMAMAVAFPVAVVLSPSFVNFPVDMAIGLAIPAHAYVGMDGVIDDYVPRGQAARASKIVLMVVTAGLVIGLLKVNLCGPGITESVKSLWRSAPKK